MAILKHVKSVLNVFVVFIAVNIFLIPVLSHGKDSEPIQMDLVYINDPWPPWNMSGEDGTMVGIDVDVIMELSKRLNILFAESKINLNINPVLKIAPWKRCLKSLKEGQADIIASFSLTKERKGYVHYLYPYRKESKVAFYFEKGQENQLKKYKDLYNLHVGVTSDYRYFDPFDDDKKIKTSAVTNIEQLVDMLKFKRFDTFIAYEAIADYYIKTKGYTGLFEKSSFTYTDEGHSYIAISKKSAFAKYLPEFNQVVKEMVEQGVIDKIKLKYTE